MFALHFLAAIIQGDAHNLSVFITGSILDFESAFRIAGIKHRIDVDGDGHCTLFHDAVQFFLNLCLALAFELAKLCSDRIFQAVVGSSSIFIVPEEQTHAQEKQENHTNRNGPMQELVTTLLRIFFRGRHCSCHDIQFLSVNFLTELLLTKVGRRAAGHSTANPYIWACFILGPETLSAVAGDAACGSSLSIASLEHRDTITLACFQSSLFRNCA